ncbi:flagellar biosynthesis anti-sigma factor FlgM [Spongiibacter sp.]|uniref:flagellar biosynthesis anti-sigma factor FlgM n=1 Tax=Spongiibacter sp. TaxID=2024860 RepID=UPI003563D24F
MVDRINGTPSGQPRRLDNSSQASSGKAAVSVNDTGNLVTTPQESNLIERSRAEVAASDGVDRQQVEAIKTAIRNGEFSIDADQVAKAFVDLELLTAPR